jgi:hypothetical protein
VQPPVPGVEFADHADPARVGSPHGEGRSVDAFAVRGMRAEDLPQAQVTALRQEPDVDLAQHGAEAIGIFELRFPAADALAQPVCKGRGLGEFAREDAGRMDALERERERAVARVDHVEPLGLRAEGANVHGACAGVHPEKRERIAVASARDRFGPPRVAGHE